MRYRPRHLMRSRWDRPLQPRYADCPFALYGEQQTFRLCYEERGRPRTFLCGPHFGSSWSTRRSQCWALSAYR